MVSPGSSSRNVFGDGHIPAFNSVRKWVKKITLKPKICAVPEPSTANHIPFTESTLDKVITSKAFAPFALLPGRPLPKAEMLRVFGQQRAAPRPWTGTSRSVKMAFLEYLRAEAIKRKLN